MFVLEFTDAGLSCGASGSAAVVDAFGEFEQAMLRAGGDTYAFERMFAPGLSEEQVHARFSAAGLTPPEELVAFWTLQDGPAAPRTALPPNFLNSISLDAALNFYKNRTASWRPNDDPGDFEDPAWFDISDQFSYLVRLDAPPPSSPVRQIWTEAWNFLEESNEHQLDSIAVIFVVAAQAIERGLLAPEEDTGIAAHRWTRTVDNVEWEHFTCGSELF